MNPLSDSTGVRKMERPAFLLNVPFSLDTRIANNATMKKLGARGRRVNRILLHEQWQALYHHLAARALVYLLPSQAGLQDQAFVANLAILPPHTRQPVALVSRFRARARAGESKAGLDFFNAMGFRVEKSPAYFEGEADLKHLRKNIYFGGHGLRSSPKAHAWLEEKHGFRIVPVPLWDPHLYHLDCVLHVLNPQRILAATQAFSPEALGTIERVAEIVDVPLSLAYRGSTNLARLGGQILADSNLPALKKTDALYPVEKAKRTFLEKCCAQTGLQPVFFNLSEFYKSGAMLSCLVLPLNYPHLSLQSLR